MYNIVVLDNIRHTKGDHIFNITSNKQILLEIREIMKKLFADFVKRSNDIELITLFQSEDSRNEIVELFMNSIVRTEFELLMGYKKYEISGLKKLNYPNGSHKKTMKTTNGEVTIEIPEDHNSEFYSAIIPKHMCRTENMSQAIMELFALCNSNSKIVKFCHKVFGFSYSRQSVSTIVEVLDELVNEFNTRKIKKSYFAIYMDVTYIPVRFNGSYEKHAVYIMIGVDQQRYQEVLGYTIVFSENKTLWEEIIINLKERGLKHCDIFIMDGAPVVLQLINKHFNNTKVQQCIVHLMRNLANKIKPRECREIMARIINIYYIDNLDIINQEFDNIIKLYPHYKKYLLITKKMSLYSLI